MFDVWEDELTNDAVAYDRQMADKHWNRLQDVHGTTGYREGLVQGKEAHLQEGFDSGFELGSHIGILVGQLKGILTAIEQLDVCDKRIVGSNVTENMNALSSDTRSELAALNKEVDTIKVENVLSGRWFMNESDLKQKDLLLCEMMGKLQMYITRTRECIQPILKVSNQERAAKINSTLEGCLKDMEKFMGTVKQ